MPCQRNNGGRFTKKKKTMEEEVRPYGGARPGLLCKIFHGSLSWTSEDEPQHESFLIGLSYRLVFDLIGQFDSDNTTFYY